MYVSCMIDRPLDIELITLQGVISDNILLRLKKGQIDLYFTDVEILRDFAQAISEFLEKEDL